jgi:hypothetical protein
MPAFLVLLACATSIPLVVQRTPNLDTSGIKRITILPFDASGGRHYYRGAAQYATNLATSKIQATGHFTLVDPSTVINAERKGESIESYVDAVFKGEITRIAEESGPQSVRVRDKNGNWITITNYVRVVEVDYRYSLARARDGALIGPIIKKGSYRASASNSSDLASVEECLNRALDGSMATLNRDVAPYTIRVSRTLENDPNKALKPQMDAALAQVKAGSYLPARDAYIAIWESTKSVAAAINASILLEAMGETQEAANFMQDVLTATGNPKARDALARLNNELGQQAGLEQMADTRSQSEKTVEYAIGELQKVLPEAAKLWILNNAKSDQDLLNDVIDNMTSALVSKGMTVVDRQMIETILKEQEFQMSGDVSDDDIVRIGNLAGANTIAVVNVAGTGAARRLQLKVLDVTAGTVILQSSTGAEWNL